MPNGSIRELMIQVKLHSACDMLKLVPEEQYNLATIDINYLYL